MLACGNGLFVRFAVGAQEFFGMTVQLFERESQQVVSSAHARAIVLEHVRLNRDAGTIANS